MTLEQQIRQILQDNRIHFKNRMAMDEVGVALIAGLKSWETPEKVIQPSNIISQATYKPKGPFQPPKVEWSEQDNKLLKDNNPGV